MGATGIFAGEGVPADDEDIEKHLDGVAEHVYFGGWGMAPANRDFDGGEAVVAGEVEELGVKAEAFDGLLLEDELAFFAAKGFEAALRVDERKAEDDADDFVEDDTGEFAEQGFVDGNEAAINGARADGDVMIFHGGEELFDFFDGGG